MFKICYIQVNYKDQTLQPSLYDFTSSNYIYGANNVGKTVMVQSIDFVLGKSGFSLETTDGLDGIDSIEAKLENGEKELYLIRTKDNNYGYKYSINDSAYLTVDEDLFKKEITAFLIGSTNRYFEEFKAYTEEDLTFRAFSFLNFVDEKGLGNLTNIFTRIDTYYNQKRARKLMMFVFNYDNVAELVRLKTQEKQLVADLDALKDQKATYNYLYAIILNGCRELQIAVSPKNTLRDINVAFQNFRETYQRNSQAESKKSGDLGVLYKISYNLSEELKYQENLERQTSFLITRSQKAQQLLDAFKSLIYIDPKYKEYIQEIEKIIKKQEISKEILSVKDFKTTINRIKNKKEIIDKQILECQGRLSKISYHDTLKAIGKVEQALLDIERIPDIREIQEKENKLQDIRNKIKDLQNQFQEKLRHKFDEELLSCYAELNNGKINFVAEDFQKKGFRMLFDPLKVSITGQKAKDSNDMLVTYNPGSMARETTWQILTYLTMFKLIREYFPELPVLPVLFIDGLNQPYDDEFSNYPSVYHFIRKKAKEIGIQLFVVSTRDGAPMNIRDQIHIKGFNKAHKV